MKLPLWGECDRCGGDWDVGGRDMPAYSNCTCPDDGNPTPDPDEARAESTYRDLDRGEL